MISKSISPLVISPDLTGDSYGCSWASWVVIVVKNSLASAGDIRDKGSIPGLGKSPGGEHGSSLQYSCLENSMGRGAWQAMLHMALQIRTGLKQLSMHTCMSFLGGSVVKNSAANAGDMVPSLCREDSLGKELETYSSILAWKVPWTKDPVRLQSILQRVGHD